MAGYLWNCRFFGRSIVRLAPDGSIDRVIDMPVKNITTAVFGGPDLRTLYVTSASASRDPGDRLAGSLWSIETEVAAILSRMTSSKPPIVVSTARFM